MVITGEINIKLKKKIMQRSLTFASNGRKLIFIVFDRFKAGKKIENVYCLDLVFGKITESS